MRTVLIFLIEFFHVKFILPIYDSRHFLGSFITTNKVIRVITMSMGYCFDYGLWLICRTKASA
jgi:hypothetical protein